MTGSAANVEKPAPLLLGLKTAGLGDGKRVHLALQTLIVPSVVSPVSVLSSA